MGRRKAIEVPGRDATDQARESELVLFVDSYDADGKPSALTLFSENAAGYTAEVNLADLRAFGANGAYRLNLSGHQPVAARLGSFCFVWQRSGRLIYGGNANSGVLRHRTLAPAERLAALRADEAASRARYVARVARGERSANTVRGGAHHA